MTEGGASVSRPKLGVFGSRNDAKREAEDMALAVTAYKMACDDILVHDARAVDPRVILSRCRTAMKGKDER